MSGGPIARLAAATVTMGTSEIGQKKPFQGLGNKDNPIGDLSGSPLRFIPFGNQAAAVGDVGINAMKPNAVEEFKPEEAPEAPSLGNATANKKRTKRAFSTILTTPMGVSGDAEVNRPSLLGGGIAKRFLGN